MSNQEKLLCSSKTSPNWCRGFLKRNCPLLKIKKPLDKFKAKAAVVGHRVQSEISTHHQGRILAIDVKHPKDHFNYWP